MPLRTHVHHCYANKGKHKNSNKKLPGIQFAKIFPLFLQSLQVPNGSSPVNMLALITGSRFNNTCIQARAINKVDFHEMGKHPHIISDGVIHVLEIANFPNVKQTSNFPNVKLTCKTTASWPRKPWWDRH